MTIGESVTTGLPAARAAGDPVHEDVDLPVNPYLALRVAFGMLLGEDDFRVLMGNPRGKQMLHSAWLHGRGVVWGLRVSCEGDRLVVAPGLAVDGHGRELHLDVPHCRSIREWAEEWRAQAAAGTGNPTTTRTEAWVVAEFGGCLDRPVPALADPCDVSRKTTDHSRIVESMSITIRPRRPGWPPGYHRVRALLGLEPLRDDDEDVRSAVEAVAGAEPHERAGVLTAQFRLMAGRDATDLGPLREAGDVAPGRFPVPDEDAGVVLARLAMDVTDHGQRLDVGSVEVDPDVRIALLPTATIQELSCGPAPDLFGAPSRPDAGGPRLVAGSVAWSEDRTRVCFDVTAPIAEGSQEGGIQVSSLSAGDRGWARSSVDRTHLANGGERVVVDLDQAPAYGTVRLVVRGTGPTPLYGRDPLVPFAGRVDGPPGSAEEGHDAVDVQQLRPADQEGSDSA
ncbi:MAG: hypothetical protein JWL64_2364 [Frankiales bacterium]|nr:hypothetical protein [Frankiales bacterium]